MHNLKEIKFKVSYCFNDLNKHSMNADIFSKSIKSLSNLLRFTNETINGNDSEYELHVIANERGSFVVDFVMYLNSNGINPLNTLGFMGGAASISTVMGVFLNISDKKISLVEKTKNGKSILYFDDESSPQEIPEELAKLIFNSEFREGINELLYTPIKNEEAEEIKFIKGDTEFSLSKRDINKIFEHEHEHEHEHDVTVERIEFEVYVISIDFENMSCVLKDLDGNYFEAKLGNKYVLARFSGFNNDKSYYFIGKKVIRKRVGNVPLAEIIIQRGYSSSFYGYRKNKKSSS